MTSERSNWIAPTGVRRVEPDASSTAIPDAAMNDPRLSLTAKGLYALLLSYQGQPIDPYDDALEEEVEIHNAVDELVACGYAVRVEG